MRPPIRLVEMYRIIQTGEELESFKEKWDNFSLRNPDFEIFFSYEWVKTWFDYFIKGHKKRRLYVIIKLDEQSGEIEAVAPLYTEKYFLFFKCLRFISDDFSDYLGISSLDADSFSGVAEKMFSGLSGFPEHAGIIFLKQLPSIQAINLKNISVTGNTGLNIKTKRSGDCYSLMLPGSVDSYMKTFNSKQRYNILKRVKDSEKKGVFPVSFNESGHTGDIKEYLEEFFNLHQKRWEGKGKKGVFHNPYVRTFFGELFNKLYDSGYLYLSFLRYGDNLIAGSICFDFNGKRQVYLPGFDPVYSGLHPGMVLTYYNISEAIKDGKTEFDFLKGGEDYKKRFLSSGKDNYKMYLYRNPVFYILFKVNMFLGKEIFARIKEFLIIKVGYKAFRKNER